MLGRGQLLAAGAQPHDLRRWQRRRELATVLPGVLIAHTGELTPLQRWWAAVLWAEPAALALTSAVRAAGGRPSWLPGDPRGEEPVHLLVAHGRHLKPPDWIRVHGCRALDTSVQWAASPPRQREEEAAIDVAVAQLRSRSRRAHLDAAGALAEPIQARRTTARRMLAALERRARVSRRDWLAGVIRDVETGATTVLEQGYLRRVQRPHGLPPALLQVTDWTPSGRVVRDAVVGHQVIELDGRAFHQGPERRDADLERDLDSAGAGLGTTRLGWGQVFDRPCQTAGKVALVLAAHGWRGVPRPCGPACTVRRAA